MTGTDRVGRSASAHYVGRDRRGSAAPTARLNRRAFLAAGSSLLCLILAFSALSRYAPLEQALDVGTASGMLGAAGVAIGALLSVLLWLRFHLTGDALALWISAGVLVFAAFTIGAGQLLPMVDVGGLDTDVANWVRPAGLLVTLALLLWPLRSAEVDTRLRPRLLLLLALGAVTWVTLVLQVLPGLTRLLVGTDPVLSPSGHLTVEPTVGIAWVALAFAYFWRGTRGKRALASWVGLMLYALAVAELTNAITLLYGPTWQIGSGTLRLAGLAFGCVGAIQELQLAFAAQSTRVMAAHVDALAQEARHEAELAERAERAHEARNALTAIEGATLTLDRNREALDPATRSILAAAVTTEIARLQQLVSEEREAGSPGPFDLEAVVEAQAVLARSRGDRVLTEVSGPVTAIGRHADTAEALQNLLLNAHKYAPGSATVVRAAIEGDHAVVRVEDQGAGVAEADRERIFARGERAAGGRGDGLGLYVARQLMRDQGGDLWLDPARPGRGASFALSLPTRSAASEDEDEVGEVAEAGEVERPAVPRGLDGAGAGAAGVGGDAHNDRSSNIRR